MNEIIVFLLKVLPLNILSLLFGVIASLNLPRPLLKGIFHFYVIHYNVKTSEAEKNLEEYKTINEFFTRKLKPGLRPVDSRATSIVSPVDGKVLSFGKITENTLEQVKGMTTNMQDLIDIPGYKTRFSGGNYIIIYLSPRDYHRIHYPVSGKLSGYSYIPGKLFPVNYFAVSSIKNLFSVNERVATYIETKNGLCSLIKVGATNVGSIVVNYDSSLKTNKLFSKGTTQLYTTPQEVKKGEELGRFEMGSTVILLFEKDKTHLEKLSRNQLLQYGESIAEWVK